MRFLQRHYGTFLTIDPRPGHAEFLIAYGQNGACHGFVSFNAETGSPLTWAGNTGGSVTSTFSVASYDVKYLQYAMQPNTSPYCTQIQIDNNGVCWTATATLWYYNNIPVFTSRTFTLNGVGRGMDMTVAQDVCCPPGATYPVCATQEVGLTRGTFTTWPQDQYKHYVSTIAENIEYSAADASFMVARATGTIGSFADYSAYSKNYGADGTWTAFPTSTTPMWQSRFTGTISNGTGGAGNILNVTAVANGVVQAGQYVCANANGNTNYGTIQPYGTSGSTGTGGIGDLYS